MKTEEAKSLLETNIGLIKDAVKDRNGIYPLDEEYAFDQIESYLSEEDYKVIRSFSKPESGTMPNLEVLVKHKMVELAYFKLEEDYFIHKIIIHFSRPRNIPSSIVPEIVLYVQQRLENNKLEKLKKFQEKCRFTTFLFSVVRRLTLDFLRRAARTNEIMEKFSADIWAHSQKMLEPELYHLGIEIDRIEREILPQEIEKLNAEEKIVLKMFYYKGFRISTIARVLSVSRYKAEQIRKNALGKIIRGIKEAI